MELQSIIPPLPLVSSHQGRGNLTFYETVKLRLSSFLMKTKDRFKWFELETLGSEGYFKN
jgi:hypothetical protein